MDVEPPLTDRRSHRAQEAGGDQRVPLPSAPGASTRPWFAEGSAFYGRPSVVQQESRSVDYVQYEKTSVAEAREEIGPDNQDGATAQRRPARGVPAREELSHAARQWLAALPDDLQPRELSRAFPRIANELCALWPDPRRCSRFLSTLLLDSRDGLREGFPIRVASEIAALFSRIEESQERPGWPTAVRSAP